MRGKIRLAQVLACQVVACLMLFTAGTSAVAQTSRPFSQLVELWTRQLDRISERADQPELQPAEIDSLRERATDIRSAAAAAAALARNDLADTNKLLAPLQPKMNGDKAATDQPPDTDAVKAERERLTEQAAISDSRIKQCEVVIARADQLVDRLAKLRAQIVLRTLLHRGASPLSQQVWTNMGPEFAAAMRSLSSSFVAWGQGGLTALRTGEQDTTPLAFWALATIALWWIAHRLRRRYGSQGDAAPGQRDRTIAAAIDGVGVVIVPILAVWLIDKVLAVSRPPAPIDALLPELTARLIVLLLVVGLSATALAPNRAAWRVLPFTDAAAQHLSTALRRLMVISVSVDFIYTALTIGSDREALNSIGALVLEVTVAILALPALSDRAWQSTRSSESDQPALIGGTWWSIARLALSAAVLSAIVCALLGYATLAAHLHSALAGTCMIVALALLAHRLASDLLDAVGAADTRSGAWARRRLGLAADANLHGQTVLLLLFDLVLGIAVVIAIPAAWAVDMDSILGGLGRVMHGVRVGGVNISLEDIGAAILAFLVCIGLARATRAVVRDRVLPSLDVPMPLRQSIDAGLNYVGVIIAILIGVSALGIDFTNLAIVLGALSVGIGLGLQNIANNVISGVILLVERPVKAGDWVSVNGHEGFVRRINIRATEIETFQRTHVIVPNSLFLQNPVINRTYADTSSRIELPITVGLGADVGKVETILREAALDHPRVLRVPKPIVRFVKMTPTGLDFELFVFVAQLEDRLVVTNDLNRTLLKRLIEEKILDPQPVQEFKLRDLGKLAQALATRTEETGTDDAPPSQK